MTYPQQRDNWGQFVNPEYNRLQSQIQQETQALLRERQQWSGIRMSGDNKYIVQQNYLRPVESQKYIKLNSDRSNNNISNQPNYLNPQSLQSNPNSNNPKNVMSEKVKELMELCKKENSQLGAQLMRVLGEQKGVYNELMSNGQSSQKTQYFGVNPIMQAQKESSVNFNSRNDQQLSSTSSRNQTPHRGGSSSGNITASMNQNVYQMQNQNTFNKTNNFRQVQQNPGDMNISNPNKLQLGEDLIQMIEEIQRKALNEIEKLREEKIDLMKQLKLQIQGNNQLQKQINTLSQQQERAQSRMSISKQQPVEQQILKQIRSEMDNLRKENLNLRMLSAKQQQQERKYQHSRQSSNQFEGQVAFNANQVNALRQRVAILQGELRSRDGFIKELSLEITRLNQQGGTTSFYEIGNLLEQGEAIRQQTLQLIRLKQGQQSQSIYQQGSFQNESQRIRELQELLEKEEEEKENFLNDLLAFKQKYQQLEEENKALKKQPKLSSSDIGRFSPIYEKSSYGRPTLNSVDDYERVLSQMRGVGGAKY